VGVRKGTMTNVRMTLIMTVMAMVMAMVIMQGKVHNGHDGDTCGNENNHGGGH
jgi:hypothetical protein